jgi:CheY-like chemotaxis protein
MGCAPRWFRRVHPVAFENKVWQNLQSHWRTGEWRPTISPGTHHIHHLMTEDSAILLVEDNEDDVVITQRALRIAGVPNPVHVVGHGADAIDYLSGAGRFADRRQHPLPAIIFLDLKLPLLSGHEVLSWIRSQRHLESMTVVVLTSSDEPSDLRRSYSLGASSYLVKPLTPHQLRELARALNWSWRKEEVALAAPPAAS